MGASSRPSWQVSGDLQRDGGGPRGRASHTREIPWLAPGAWASRWGLGLLWLMVFSGGLLWPGGFAHACSCKRPDPAAAFEAADAVFEGRVTAVHRLEGPASPVVEEGVPSLVSGVGPQARVPAIGGDLEVVLQVLQVWKGDARILERRLRTPSQGERCGLDFSVGERWLVYASSTMQADKGQPVSEVNACGRSGRVARLGAEVRALGVAITPFALAVDEGNPGTAPVEASQDALPAVAPTHGGCAGCAVPVQGTHGGTRWPALGLLGLLGLAWLLRPFGSGRGER